jgi:enoyl-CoA hydratase
LIGASRAHDLIMSARSLDAEEAERYGIVTRIAPDEEILGTALELADELCEFTPFGLFATKQVMWANLDIPNLEAAIQLENRNQIMASTSGETEEVARAFFEKRRPRWNESD